MDVFDPCSFPVMHARSKATRGVFKSRYLYSISSVVIRRHNAVMLLNMSSLWIYFSSHVYSNGTRFLHNHLIKTAIYHFEDANTGFHSSYSLTLYNENGCLRSYAPILHAISVGKKFNFHLFFVVLFPFLMENSKWGGSRMLSNIKVDTTTKNSL